MLGFELCLYHNATAAKVVGWHNIDAPLHTNTAVADSEGPMHCQASFYTHTSVNSFCSPAEKTACFTIAYTTVSLVFHYFCFSGVLAQSLISGGAPMQVAILPWLAHTVVMLAWSATFQTSQRVTSTAINHTMYVREISN